jgi:putative endonuclease
MRGSPLTPAASCHAGDEHRSSGMPSRPWIAVYIMTNRRHGTLYIGVTADLESRVGQHKTGEITGFTSTHGLNRLAWFEQHDTIVGAIRREKSLKKYKREWKINLIERDNPQRLDLAVNWGKAL